MTQQEKLTRATEKACIAWAIAADAYLDIFEHGLKPGQTLSDMEAARVKVAHKYQRYNRLRVKASRG